MEVNDLEFCWKFIVKAKPVDIWAKISDTNLIFEYLKLPSVRQTSLSRSAQKQTQALTYQGILSYQMWEEEPYHWEHPYRFGTPDIIKSDF